MNVARFEPWNLINLVHRDLDQLADRRVRRPNREASYDWTPAVDVIEEASRFVLRADLPGVSVDDIDLRMDKGVLSIAGERRRENADDANGVQRYERVAGKFFRRFSLPETADADNIGAKSVNGILEVHIPKQPEVQPRRIEVQGA